MKTDLETIREIIENQFLDIVEDILEPSGEKLRVVLKDGLSSCFTLRIHNFNGTIKLTTKLLWESKKQNRFRD